MTRRIQISLETSETLIIRRTRTEVNLRCPHCAGSAPMVTLEQAMAATGLSSRAVHRLAEAGEVHFTETEDGGLLICPASLLPR